MRSCAPATGINSPQRGVKSRPPARAWERSSAWGGTPRPPGLRPLARLRAPGPCCLRSPSRRVPGTGAPGGQGGQPLAVVHAGRPAPPPLPWIQFFKSRATGRGQAAGFVHRRRQSLQRRRWADPGTARRAAVHLGWAAGLSTATAGSGRSGSSEQSNRANIFSFAQPTAQAAPVLGFKRTTV